MKFWDLLSNRYANPFPVINVMIANGTLSEFLTQMFEQIEEEKFWQLYLSRALLEEKSFDDWLTDIKGNNNQKQKKTKPIDVNVEATVQKAENILQNFNPF